MTSLWLMPDPASHVLPGGEHALAPVTGRYDVAVVGAGLTGLTTALLLARSGRRVVVLEARYVGAGTTGSSTAKVALLQGTRLSAIHGRHGDELVRQYLAGNRAGQEWLLGLCSERDVPVQRRAAVTYAAGPDQLDATRSEHDVAAAAGLAVEWHEQLDVPFPAVGAVGLADQAQVDPVDVLSALVQEAEAAGVTIRTDARVRDAHGQDGGVVTTRGTVQAEHVVLATGIPFADRGGYFARLEPERSYALALQVREPTGLDMYLSAGTPARSVRTAPWQGGEAVLVGGNGHVVGRAESPRARTENLLSWARRWFPGAELVARWSAQDYHPVDELPYVGPLTPRDRRVLVATGFAKWGMTNAVAAAHVLTGVLDDRLPEWADAYRSWSRHETSGISQAVRVNAGVAAQLAGGYARVLTSPASTRAAPADGDPTTGGTPEGAPTDQPGTDGGRSARPAATSSCAPPEGAGCVAREGLHPVAVSTVDGVTRSVSAVCPHLGGVLRWNDEERSWDCPLHGSRFSAEGELLEGPATRGLPPR